MDATETPESPDSRTTYDRLLPGPGLLLSRGLLYVVGLMILALGLWAIVARVDVVITARGTLTLLGDAFGVTVPESALVVDVPVQVGMHVAKGDPLLRLDEYRHASEAQKIEAELMAREREVDRLNGQIRAIRATTLELQEEIGLVENSVTTVTGQAETFKTLAKEGIFSSLEAQEKEKELLDAKARLTRLRSERNRNEAQVGQIELQLAETKARTQALHIELGRYREFKKRMTLESPVAGTVVHLEVKHPGSVLNAGKPVVLIAPDHQPLEARIRIPNADIRRLKPGQSVRLRLDAFPYQRFGFIHGQLRQIDPNPDETGFYVAHISIASQKIQGTPLRAGLELESQIIIERRRLVSLALDPLRQLKQPLTTNE